MIKGYRQLNVIFKPANSSRKPSQEDLVAATVSMISAVRDWPLQPKALPSRGVKPIQIAAQDTIEGCR